MSDNSARVSWKKRFLLILAALISFVLLFVVAIRVTVNEMFRGIASSRATGLSAIEPRDTTSMWSSGGGYLQKGSSDFATPWIVRSADLRTRSSSFERSVASLHQIVSAHHGYLEDLRTESRSHHGRVLAASVSVPTDDFDAALVDLQTLGRTEAVSQMGEDSAVKLATSARRLAAEKVNLSRLQKLQRERRGELHDAVALEKDIAQAGASLAETEREHEMLLSTVAQAHIHLTLMEDYRAPFQLRTGEALREVRNSLAEGVSGIFSSFSLFLGILLGYGLPIGFWLALLFWPLRAVWRRYHRMPAVASAQ
jgi:Domain of unknown function (DUF4349)